MSSSKLADPSRTLNVTERASPWVLAGIGMALAGAFLFDAYTDRVFQRDPLWSTALENFVPTVLASVLPYVGWRLSQSSAESVYAREIAKWTMVACVGVLVVSGLAVGIQALQGEIKPAILILQVATVGAVGGLWVGYNLARVKVAEQKAVEDRDRLANLLEGLPAPVVHGKFDGGEHEIIRVNSAFEEAFGLEVEKVEGKNLYDLVVPEAEREKAADIDRQAIDEGFVDREVQRLTSEGPRDFQLRVAEALGDGASETYAIYTDITERKKREERLRRTTARLSALYDNSPDMINIHDPEGTILDPNPRFLKQTGYGREDVEGMKVWKIDKNIDPADAAALWEDMETGDRVELEGAYQRKDGSVFPTEVHIRRLDLEGDDRFMAISRDVTERKEREASLKRVNTRLQLALESSNTGTFDWNLETGEIIWDEISEQLFGYEPGGFPERHEAWTERVHPDDLSEVERKIERAIEHGEVYDVVFRVQPSDGRQRWVRAQGSVEDDGEGNPTRVIGLHTDVTDQKRREQELIEARKETEETSRLRTAMLANMSHEIRTPLTSITGFSEILDENLDGRLEAFATKIYEGSQRLQRTLESVLHLSKLEAGAAELDREEVALQDAARDVMETLGQAAEEKSITVTMDAPTSPVLAYWNEDALFRICRNLVENAIKFTPEDGRVDIRIRENDHHGVLEIEDEGIGMNPENVPELFKAFKQESEGMAREYEGSGLGLSIVKRLTEELGGAIDVETERGEGTSFSVRLPLS
ncbi:MAG: PAS domain S-box protein [Salinibacter sp.]